MREGIDDSPLNGNGQIWKYVLYLIIVAACVLFVLYVFLHFTFDSSSIVAEEERLMEKLRDGPLQSLLNGSGINNIPTLNLITTNTALSKANNCGKGPVLIGSTGNDADCVKTCANSSAKAILVRPGERYVYDNGVLDEGVHCVVGPRPECDMKTTIAMMTVNSVICRSKFPNIVGGALGTTVVACNDQRINDPQNYLWDYKNNVKFDPMATTVLDEDELLPDGTYRFRCKFNGYDTHGNKYQEHPYNRFHPIENYCAALIYRAHPDVQTVFDEHEGYKCDCGDIKDTRVSPVDPSDSGSQCGNEIRDDSHVTKNMRLLRVPYRCFTLYSPIEDVGKYPPCPKGQFTREGSRMSSAYIFYSEKYTDVIEHPYYHKFSDEGAKLLVGRLLE